jgi:D-alanyl-D-alanine carboxypeptidase
MYIPPKFSDFLASFGVMVLGVALVFAGSVSVKKIPDEVWQYPVSGLRKVFYREPVATVLPPSRPRVPLQTSTSTYPVELTAASVLVVDDGTNTVLFSKNATEVRPLASITKLMAALILMDLKPEWATSTVVTTADFSSSSHFINVGEKFKIEDLWHIALIGSSNSAINTLVRNTGLTPDNFAILMNRKAKEIGLSKASFVEPTGLDEKNVADASDVARLLKEALEIDKIKKTLQIGQYYSHPIGMKKERRLWSTNWLLTNWVPNRFAEDKIVGKTGFINDSKYNFTVRIEDDNHHAVRIVVLGSESNESRFSEARDLAEWIFKNYLWPGDEGYDELWGN